MYNVYFNKEETDVEYLWGKGKVFQLLLEDNQEFIQNEKLLNVRWFGSDAVYAHVKFEPGRLEESVVEINTRFATDLLLKTCWLNAIFERISKSVEVICTEIVNALTSKPCYGVLLAGSHGMGKSWILDVLAETYVKLMNCGHNSVYKINQSGISDIKRVISNIDNCDGLIILDDIDRIIPKPINGKRQENIMHNTLIIRALERARNRHAFVVASSTTPNLIQPEALVYGVLDRTVYLLAPNFQETQSQLMHGGNFSDEQSLWLAQRTAGWTRAEIESFAQKLVTLQSEKSPRHFDSVQINQILAQARRNIAIFRESSIVIPADTQETLTHNVDNFAPLNLGGFEHERALLVKSVVSFFQNREIGVQGTRGILLHGPTGNGKTALGTAIGNYVQNLGLATFIRVRCLDLVSKVVGETESNLARIFTRVRDCAPCILFLDQLDAIAPKRSQENETTERTFERILSVLLVQLDGILTKDFHNKFAIIASTRKLDDLEPAIVRPGRLGFHIHIGPPDSTEECVKILVACTRNIPLGISSGFFTHIAEAHLRGKNRAEIANLCREAGNQALRRDIYTLTVLEEDFFNAMKV
jgi:transitional endoplasmic reticulum ATPase